MHKTKPTILFDLDGTLIDSTCAILQGFEAAFAKFEFPAPPDSKITQLIGYPLDVMFASLGVKTELISDFIDEYKKTYQSIYLEHTTLLKGGDEAVKFAASFSDVGVVTTKTSKFSQILLDHLDVAKFIKVIIGKEDVKLVKPDPEPVLKALAILQKPTKDTFMIGDTKLDGLAAAAASVKSIGVMCGYGSEAELKEHCDFLAANALDAVKFIANLQ